MAPQSVHSSFSFQIIIDLLDSIRLVSRKEIAGSAHCALLRLIASSYLFSFFRCIVVCLVTQHVFNACSIWCVAYRAQRFHFPDTHETTRHDPVRGEWNKIDSLWGAFDFFIRRAYINAPEVIELMREIICTVQLLKPALIWRHSSLAVRAVEKRHWNIRAESHWCEWRSFTRPANANNCAPSVRVASHKYSAFLDDIWMKWDECI